VAGTGPGLSVRMHDDEIDSDGDLVRRLLDAQRPQWAGLPIERVISTGTDNALYRLGDDLVVRLPRRPSSVAPLEKECRWLPVLAPRLPLAVPVPLAIGVPTAEFPWPWTVYPWLRGGDATTVHFDLPQAARELARFIVALQRVDPTGGPEPGVANFGRGVPLAERDAATRQAIDDARHLIDASAVAAAWDEARHAPGWDRSPVWIHGDIAGGNLVVRDGRLRAVIDWGALAVGDPACDLIVAWELFDAAARDVLRAELNPDESTWARGRGWALSTAIIALPYYEGTSRFMASQARRKIAAVLADAR
jgi:aminoglycoside phosphotransferase (APT) family kinase protein